jgi:hypothetical protein
MKIVSFENIQVVEWGADLNLISADGVEQAATKRIQLEDQTWNVNFDVNVTQQSVGNPQSITGSGASGGSTTGTLGPLDFTATAGFASQPGLEVKLYGEPQRSERAGPDGGTIVTWEFKVKITRTIQVTIDANVGFEFGWKQKNSNETTMGLATGGTRSFDVPIVRIVDCTVELCKPD